MKVIFVDSRSPVSEGDRKKLEDAGFIVVSVEGNPHEKVSMLIF